MVHIMSSIKRTRLETEKASLQKDALQKIQKLNDGISETLTPFTPWSVIQARATAQTNLKFPDTEKTSQVGPQSSRTSHSSESSHSELSFLSDIADDESDLFGEANESAFGYYESDLFLESDETDSELGENEVDFNTKYMTLLRNINNKLDDIKDQNEKIIDSQTQLVSQVEKINAQMDNYVSYYKKNADFVSANQVCREDLDAIKEHGENMCKHLQIDLKCKKSKTLLNHIMEQFNPTVKLERCLFPPKSSSGAAVQEPAASLDLICE